MWSAEAIITIPDLFHHLPSLSTIKSVAERYILSRVNEAWRSSELVLHTKSEVRLSFSYTLL